MSRPVEDSVGMRLIQTGGQESAPLRRARTHTVAFVSGKGGVGKTALITNLALALQRLGRRVLLVDGDWGMGNVDIYMGLCPKRNVHDLVAGRCGTREALIETEGGLRILPGASGVEEMENLDDLRCERLLCSLTDVEEEIDMILLDTSSGIHRTTTHMAWAADEIVVVSTPEPAASLDAYACLKVLSRSSLPGTPWILINQSRNATEAAEVTERIRSVARRHLDLEAGYLGHMLEDPAVGSAIRRQEPFLKLFPNAPGAACIHRIAERLDAMPEPEPRGAADPEEVRRVANMEDASA